MQLKENSRFKIATLVRNIALYSLFTAMVNAQESQQDEWDLDAWDAIAENDSTSNVSPITGFVELAYSHRLQTDPVLDRPQTLADARMQFQWDYALQASQLKTRADIYYDGVKNNTELQIRELAWQGSLSQLSILGELGQHFDAKVGQQVLTWGTGDYLFLNDLFPKDYQSFFSGRDDEYLKAPSFAAKLSGYFDWVNLDFVITPRFTPDNFINGEYYSFFSPVVEANIASEFHVASENRPTSPEYHLRLHKTLGSHELAFYGYKGYSPLPSASDSLGRPKFTDINVYGFSLVTPIGPGIVKFEYAYQNALEDTSGENPYIPNSMSKYLVGYEQEIIANLTGSIQWYTERTQEHGLALANSFWPQFEQEKVRNVVTTQLIYRALRQTLTFNLFNFYSPSDEDGYLRFRSTYSPVDQWSISAGVNVFYGDKKHTFFNQFDDASNGFLSYRYYYTL
ncbi:hypothetical protein [Alteromonas sp. a30]|uniref:hypothetical protein n=1 Tax=Alteromonas sp. a30 TaxID=2730917 RepID=UPI00227FF4B5|nr:hypothetical protein [Alteromonas sp. a30]MCY7296803.1 hypothetical protein [Alteromonas sp. a30]